MVLLSDALRTASSRSYLTFKGQSNIAVLAILRLADGSICFFINFDYICIHKQCFWPVCKCHNRKTICWNNLVQCKQTAPFSPSSCSLKKLFSTQQSIEGEGGFHRKPQGLDLRVCSLVCLCGCMPTFASLFMWLNKISIKESSRFVGIIDYAFLYCYSKLYSHRVSELMPINGC